MQVNSHCVWLDAPLHGIAIDVRGCEGGEGGVRGGEALPSSSDMSCDPPADHAPHFCTFSKKTDKRGHNFREAGYSTHIVQLRLLGVK